MSYCTQSICVILRFLLVYLGVARLCLEGRLVGSRAARKYHKSNRQHGRVLLALAVVLTWGQEADAVIDVKCVKKTLVTQRYSQEPLFPSLLEGGGCVQLHGFLIRGPAAHSAPHLPFLLRSSLFCSCAFLIWFCRILGCFIKGKVAFLMATSANIQQYLCNSYELKDFGHLNI